MKSIRILITKWTNWKIERWPEMADDMDIDQNGMNVQVKITYTFKIFKLVLLILNVIYFIGVFWLIYCEIGD